MRTIITEKKVYQFGELTQDQQDKAIEKLYDINIDREWWDYYYSDAATVGLEIDSFDIDYRSIRGTLIWSGSESADLIKKEHGENCGTYKLAEQFTKDWNELVEKYSDGVKKDTVTEENTWDFDGDGDGDELEEDFKNELLQEYLILLRKEYEYLTSREAIIETIEANEYEFDEQGKLA